MEDSYSIRVDCKKLEPSKVIINGEEWVRKAPAKEVEATKESEVDKSEALESAVDALGEHIDKLTEAAKELIHLHACEQEGLSSGQPTHEQWIEAVDKLSKICRQDSNQK